MTDFLCFNKGTLQTVVSYLEPDHLLIHSALSSETTEHIIKAVNAKTVAEGIESEAVWVWLLELGCVEGQGFYMSHAIEAKAFEQWFVSWNEKALIKRFGSA